MLLATPDVISDKPEQTPEEEFFYLLDKLRKQQLQDEQEASQGNYDESLKSSQEGLSPDSSYINPGINPGFPYAMPSVYEPSNYYKKKAKLLDDELVEKVLEQCPAEIEEAIDIINDNSHETSLRIILSGSPGVGKTTVAKAIAQRTGHTYILLRGTALSNLSLIHI